MGIDNWKFIRSAGEWRKRLPFDRNRDYATVSQTQSGVEFRHEIHTFRVDDDFARMFEIDGDATADIRLYLPQPPIGTIRVADQHARFQQGARPFHLHLLGSGRRSMSEYDLEALIGSRICHDLISPLGAIGNGVELLAMSGAGDSPEIALISDSVENANARIRYFRVSFGAASPGQRLAGSEIRAILSGYWKDSRVQVDWQVQGDVDRQDAKLVLLLMQCLETAMPWGGRLTVSGNGENWQLTGAAERLSIDRDLWDHIEKPGSELTPITSAAVHFALAPRAAFKNHRDVSLDLSPTLITLSF